MIGLGTWPLGGNAYGSVDELTARVTVTRALETGIGLFDTADVYGGGSVETLLGSMLPASSEIVGKVGYLSESADSQDFGGEHVTAAVLSSLRRLGRPTLDVLLLHSPPASALTDDRVRATFERVVENGWASRIGVSLRSVYDGEAALSWSAVSDVEVILNAIDQRAIDTGLVDECRRRGIRILARLPLCSGMLSGNYRPGHRFPPADRRSRWPGEQVDAWLRAADELACVTTDGDVMRAALQFLLAMDGVVPIPGMKTASQVERSVEASRHRADAKEYETVRDLWRNKFAALPPV